MVWIWRVCSIILLLSILACSVEKEVNFHAIDFQYKGNSWDTIPYQFSQTIENVVLKEQGNQLAATQYASTGAYEKVLKTWDLKAAKRFPLTEEDVESFKQYHVIDAHDVIIEKSRATKVTIINEAHHISLHRVFTTTLLQDLWDNGYRHLGLEAYFSTPERDSILVQNGYPSLTDGYYVKEPQFGNLIREALTIGYKVFGYESNGHTGPKERDINQAKNIEDYMSSNPDGKVLIHCGYAHGSEGEYGGQWERTMAARLTEYMGINPLTIDQTTYREMSDPSFENPYYTISNVQKPSVFLNGDEVFGEYRGGESWFDLHVFHPKTQDVDMPEWLLYDDREMLEVSFEKEEINCPCMILVYKEGEKIGQAVPYHTDETNDKSAKVVVGKGGYQIVILSYDGSAIMGSIHR